MLSQLFLGMSLLGAEWVLYLLVLLSIFSVTLIIERALYYRAASKQLLEFRSRVRQTATEGKWEDALKLAQERAQNGSQDLDSQLALAVIGHTMKGGNHSVEVLNELSRDTLMRSRLSWDRNLSTLATIGNNAPFIGLFGTVLGIIKAFHDLSQQAGTGAQGVTAGISEALVATAFGLLVAIPAVAAFNMYQRRVKAAVSEAEALKSFLIGKLAK